MRRIAPRREQVERLRAIPLFAGCSDKELAAVDRLCDEFAVDEGTVLTEQGARGHQAFVVVWGRAAVEVDGKTIASKGPGDCIGEMALLSNPTAPRSATVTAQTPMELLVFEPRALSTLVKMPSVAKKLLRDFSDRLRDADEVIAQG